MADHSSMNTREMTSTDDGKDENKLKSQMETEFACNSSGDIMKIRYNYLIMFIL